MPIVKLSPTYVAPTPKTSTMPAFAKLSPKPSTMPTIGKPSPAYFSPTPKTSEMTGSAALIVERLEKIEHDSRDLRELVLQLSDSTPFPIEQLSDDAATMTDVMVTDQGTAVAPGPDNDWILTTHVGSLPRDTGELAARTIIDKQLAAGISLLNDGEWSRENYIADLLSRLKGVGSDDPSTAGPKCLCEMPVAEDMRAVPTYAKRFTGGNGLITLNPKRIATADQACTEWPTYLGTDGLYANLNPFLEGLKSAGVPIKKAFWGCPSPGTLATFCEDQFFCGDHGAYVMALAEAMRPEYEAVAATGLQLQIDCPDLAMGRHTRFTHLSDKEFDDVSTLSVQALNAALINVPREQVHKPPDTPPLLPLTPADPPTLAQPLPGAHSHLLGQLRGAAPSRHPH